MSSPSKVRKPSRGASRLGLPLRVDTSDTSIDPYTTLPPSRSRRRSLAATSHVVIDVQVSRPWTEPGLTRAEQLGTVAVDAQPGISWSDPRVDAAGLNVNLGSEEARPQRMDGGDRLRIVRNRVGFRERLKFITTASKAFAQLGAPIHRIEVLIAAGSAILDLDTQLVALPSFFLITFKSPVNGRSDTRMVLYSSTLTLEKLQDIYVVYWRVCHDETSASDGTRDIEAIIDRRSYYSTFMQVFFSFVQGFVIAGLGFDGAFIDMCLAGLFSSVITIIARFVHREYWVTPVQMAIMVVSSFIARGLSAIPSANICYNAVASGGIITILPGLLVLSASLEVASGSMISGSMKIVWAFTFSLVIGFCLQGGSSIYLWFDPKHKDYIHSIAASVVPEAEIMGMYKVIGTNWILPAEGEFNFMPESTAGEEVDLWIGGCYRPTGLPWYNQPLSKPHLAWLVPTFALVLTLSAGQPWRRVDTLGMIGIAIAASTVNWFSDEFIFGRGHVFAFMSAALCGVLGFAWARVRRRAHVAPFVAMAPGILFLLPSGLAIAGGISQEPDVVSIGKAMVYVSSGITCGLLLAQALVQALSSRAKRTAQLSF